MKRKKTKLIFGLFISLVLSACGFSQDADYELIPVRQVDTWGYIDHNGSWVINPQFEDAECFFDGLARVESNGKVGYINKEGQLVINSIYQNGTRFSEGYAFVLTDDEKFLCIDTEGKTKFTLSDDVNEVGIFYNSLALVSNGSTGYVKTDGTMAIDFVFNSGFYKNTEGLIGIIQEGKYGFCDMSGKVVIAPQFKGSYHFSEGLCAVYDGSKWGFINKDGKYEINPQFEEAREFSEGLCLIKQGGKYGFIDKSGKIVINPQFESSWDFRNALCSVQQNGKFGYIDKKGKIVINPQFNGASYFYGDLAVVENSGQIGLINKQGKYEINPQFVDLKRPDVFQRSVTKTRTAGSTAPRMSFNEAVLQNCVAESENIGKKISAAKKLDNPTFDNYYVFYPANVNIKGVKEARNFWQCDRNLQKGKSTSATIKAIGMVLTFENGFDTHEIDNLIDGFIDYVCYEKDLFDADEFGPNFGHGISQYGHHNAWVFNSKKYLSWLLDTDGGYSVTIYASRDGRYLDNFMQKLFRDVQKSLEGENFENMFDDI